MSTEIIQKYTAQVKRHLLCDKPQKQALIAGLEQELLDADFPSDLTLKQLYSEIGTPTEVAEAISESIPKEERVAYQKKKRFARWIVLIAHGN